MLYVSFYRILMMVMMVLIMAPSSSYSLTQTLLLQRNVGAEAQSYHEWKSSKTLEAQIKIKSLKEKIEVDPNLLNKSGGSEAGLSKEIEIEILKLSLTQDLTFSDYFAGYLSEDVVGLMSAYAQGFFQKRPGALKCSSRADLSQ